MYFNGKTVSSTPDLAYSLHLESFAGVTDIQDTILFVIEVKSVGFSDQNSSYFTFIQENNTISVIIICH